MLIWQIEDAYLADWITKVEVCHRKVAPHCPHVKSQCLILLFYIHFTLIYQKIMRERERQSFWFSDLFHSDVTDVICCKHSAAMMHSWLLQNKSGYNIVLSWRWWKAKLNKDTLGRTVKRACHWPISSAANRKHVKSHISHLWIKMTISPVIRFGHGFALLTNINVHMQDYRDQLKKSSCPSAAGSYFRAVYQCTKVKKHF